MQKSLCCAWLAICSRWSFLLTRVLMNRTLSDAIFSSPSKWPRIQRLFWIRNEKIGSFPNIIWRGTSTSSHSKFPGSFKKKINEGVYVLELIICWKRLCPAIFDSFEGHFTHALCRGTGSINEFLYAIGSRGVGRIRDGNANPRSCFGFE